MWHAMKFLCQIAKIFEYSYLFDFFRQTAYKECYLDVMLQGETKKMYLVFIEVLANDPI